MKMAPGLQEFQINLDSADKIFAPGDLMTGNIVVDFSRPKSIRTFKIRIKGTAKVEWRETSGTGKDSETDWYRADEQYFRMEAVLLGGSGNGENVEMEAGRHVYPFRFCLPHNIPSSFQCDGGCVRYTIKAIMDRPWKFDHEASLIFTVVAPYDLNEDPTATNSIVDEDQDSFCCLLVPCISMGSMKYNFYLPERGFAIGEPIEAKVKIDNSSRSVDVTKLKLSLEQKIKLYARTKTKTLKNVVQKTTRIGPFGQKIDTSLNLQVPAVPLSSLKHCNIIDLEYRLAFHIGVSGCHCGTTKTYPVVIGTRSAPNWQSIRNEDVVPGLTQWPAQLGGSEGSNAPSAPVIFDITPSPSDRIPFPMPTMDQFGNPSSLPPYPMLGGMNQFGNPLTSANQLYPGPGGSAGFQYPMGTNPPIGFVPPSPMNPTTTGASEIPPPSYDVCMRMSQSK